MPKMDEGLGSVPNTTKTKQKQRKKPNNNTPKQSTILWGEGSDMPTEWEKNIPQIFI